MEKSIQAFCRSRLEEERLTNSPHLILVNLSILQLSFSLLLECDDDQSYKDVDKEEWKDDEEDNVEDGHFSSE